MNKTELAEALKLRGIKATNRISRDSLEELLLKVEDEEPSEEEDPETEIGNLIIRLKRSASGNHWEHAQPRDDGEDAPTE